MRTKIEGIECDRCGEAEQFEDGIGGNARHEWGQVYAANLHGHDKVGSKTVPDDLCPACLDDLVKFIGGASLQTEKRAKAPASTSERQPA